MGSRDAVSVQLVLSFSCLHDVTYAGPRHPVSSGCAAYQMQSRLLDWTDARTSGVAGV